MKPTPTTKLCERLEVLTTIADRLSYQRYDDQDGQNHRQHSCREPPSRRVAGHKRSQSSHRECNQQSEPSSLRQQDQSGCQTHDRPRAPPPSRQCTSMDSDDDQTDHDHLLSERHKEFDQARELSGKDDPCLIWIRCEERRAPEPLNCVAVCRHAYDEQTEHPDYCPPHIPDR